jgi:transcriptional regulator with GAF, ATPase, and Fis domain
MGGIMEWTSPELIVALFFLVGLLLLARFRKQLRAVDRGSYAYIAAGMSLLSMVALAQVYHKAGALDELGILADARFYHLMVTIAVLGGICALVYGVSSWLPLHREQVEYSESRLSRHSFLKRVVQLTAVERRFRTLLTTTAEYMCQHFSVSQASVFLVSRRTLRTYMIGSGADAFDAEALKGIAFDTETLKDGLQRLRGSDTGLITYVPEGLRQPTAILPVVAKGRIVSLILLWAEQPLEPEEKAHLRLACDMVGDHLSSEVDRSYVRMYRRQAQVAEDAASRIAVTSALKDNVAAAFGAVREHMSAEYFSLILTEGAECRQRITVGENETVLNELGSSNRETAMLVNLAQEVTEPTVLDEQDLQRLSTAEGLLAGSGMRSMLLLPLHENGTLTAVVIFATRHARAYARRHCVVASGLLPVMGRLVQQEHHEHQARVLSTRTDRLSALAQKIASGQPQSEVLEHTARMLLDEVGTSVVRISTFDATSAFIQSQALAMRRADGTTAPSDGFIILSVCPLHEQVRDTGRPILINQENSENRLSDIEASQVFGGTVKGALLVPVRSNDHVTAVISLAEQRTWKRRQYRSSEIQFVSIVAGLLTSVMPESGSRRRSVESVLQNLDMDTNGRCRVKSSLTGILGSVEMLRTDRTMNPDKVDRYLGIIDKATRRLQECVLPVE